MQVVAGQSKKAAEVALRILDGEKVGDIKPSFVQIGGAYVRLATNAAVGNQREQFAARQHSLLPRANGVGAVFVADRAHRRGYSLTSRADLGPAT